MAVATTYNTALSKVVTVVMTLFIGITNFIFHYVTDWYLGTYVAKVKGVYIEDGIFTDKMSGLVLPNALLYFSGTGDAAITTPIVMILSGYFTWKFISCLLRKERPSVLLYLLMIVFWLVKIPMPVEYSNCLGLNRMMFFYY